MSKALKITKPAGNHNVLECKISKTCRAWFQDFRGEGGLVFAKLHFSYTTDNTMGLYDTFEDHGATPEEALQNVLKRAKATIALMAETLKDLP